MPQPEGTAPREGIRTQLRLPKVPPAIRPLPAADPGREPRSCGLSLAALALGALISATAAPAHAQTATTGQTLRPWTAPPASADPLSIASPRPLSFLATAAKTEDLGPLPGVTEFANTLANHGIYLSLGYVEDLMANVSGGIQTGTMPTGELYFGSTLDLHKLLGIPEASIHITFDERNGYNLNNIVGTQGVLQSNSGPTRTIRLSELYWQQGFLDNRIKFKVGRTNPTGDFATLPLSCEFAGVICAQPTSWYFSNDDEAYPVSTWGGDVNIKVTPHVYLRAGVYDDDLDQFASTEHGFGWGLTGSKGAFVPVQIGYSTSFSQARYPSHFNLGGYYDSAAYTPPGGMEQRGRSAIWVEGEQTVWRPDPATKQSFTLFAGGIVYRHGAPYLGAVFRRLPGPRAVRRRTTGRPDQLHRFLLCQQRGLFAGPQRSVDFRTQLRFPRCERARGETGHAIHRPPERDRALDHEGPGECLGDRGPVRPRRRLNAASAVVLERIAPGWNCTAIQRRANPVEQQGWSA